MAVSDALDDLPLGVKIRVAGASFVGGGVAVMLLSVQQLVAVVTVGAIVGILLREWWRGGGR